MINGKTYLTINTDASFYQDERVGGYAFYIICDLFKITKGGKFKNRVNDATTCEVMAIANAIATLLAQKELPKIDCLIINTDCIPGIKTIKEYKGSVGNLTARMLLELVKRLGNCDFKFKHVRAHTGVDDPRSHVNDWCDQEAKKWARIAKKEIK